MLTTFKLWLPVFWAPPLVNGDYSGLDEEGEKSLRRWIMHHPPQFSTPAHVSEMYEFRQYHDAAGYVLPCDCAEYSYFKEVATK